MRECIAKADLLRRKRDLRLRIGRSRRRIDRQLHTLRGGTRQLLSWRTYVVRYPLAAMTLAVGAGIAASAGLRPGRVTRRMGVSLVERALGHVRTHLWAELQRVWAESTPDR
jgi:hypothetical protein